MKPFILVTFLFILTSQIGFGQLTLYRNGQPLSSNQTLTLKRGSTLRIVAQLQTSNVDEDDIDRFPDDTGIWVDSSTSGGNTIIETLEWIATEETVFEFFDGDTMQNMYIEILIAELVPVSWDGETSTNWFEPTNWVDDTLPSTSDAVLIPGGTAFNPIISSAQIEVLASIKVAGSLTIDGQLNIIGYQEIGFENAGLVAINGELTIQNSTNLAISNTGTDFQISGSIYISNIEGNGIYSNSSFYNDGTVELKNIASVAINNSGTVTNNGTLIISTSNLGIWNNASASIFNNYGRIYLNSAGQALIQDQAGSFFINHLCAAIFMDAGSALTHYAGTFTNNGLLSYQHASFAVVNGTFDNTNGFIYDPQNHLNCSGFGAGTCLDFPLTYSQFVSDEDGDNLSFCEGDTDCPFGTLVINGLDDGWGSLRSAIACANPGDTVTFSGPFDILPTSGEYAIAKDLTIIGCGAEGTVITGQNDELSRIFSINNSTVSMKGLTISDGGSSSASVDGAAIQVDNISHLSLQKCVFRNNQTSGIGGVLYSFGGQIKAVNCIFAYNRGAASVGWFQGGSKSVFTNSLLHSNVSTDEGTIMNLSSELLIDNTTLTANTNSSRPCIYSQDATSNLVLHNSIIYNNTIGDVQDASGSFSATSNIIGSYTGASNPIGMNNNTSEDPQFVGSFNYRLQATSPAIDAGDKTLLPPDSCDIDDDGDLLERVGLDLEDGTRLFHGEVDKGAYEWSNDLCANALPIRCGQLFVDSTGETTSKSFNCLGDNRGLWYYLIGTGDSVAVSTCGAPTDYDTRLIVADYCGDTIVCKEDNDDFCALRSQVSFLTQPGAYYYIFVGGFQLGSVGTFALSVECLCGNQVLNFVPPYNFLDGSNYHARTDNEIHASNLINSGADITYDGAQGVLLYQSFEVQSGALFQAATDGCVEAPMLREPIGLTPDQQYAKSKAGTKSVVGTE